MTRGIPLPVISLHQARTVPTTAFRDQTPKSKPLASAKMITQSRPSSIADPVFPQIMPHLKGDRTLSTSSWGATCHVTCSFLNVPSDREEQADQKTLHEHVERLHHRTACTRTGAPSGPGTLPNPDSMTRSRLQEPGTSLLEFSHLARQRRTKSQLPSTIVSRFLYFP